VNFIGQKIVSIGPLLAELWSIEILTKVRRHLWFENLQQNLWLLCVCFDVCFDGSCVSPLMLLFVASFCQTWGMKTSLGWRLLAGSQMSWDRRRQNEVRFSRLRVEVGSNLSESINGGVFCINFCIFFFFVVVGLICLRWCFFLRFRCVRKVFALSW